jgi:hypothetical protein
MPQIVFLSLFLGLVAGVQTVQMRRCARMRGSRFPERMVAP